MLVVYTGPYKRASAEDLDFTIGEPMLVSKTVGERLITSAHFELYEPASAPAAAPEITETEKEYENEKPLSFLNRKNS